MPYRVFIVYNVIGGIVWGAGVTLLGYLLGQIQFIADNVDIIFLLIVFVSVLPIISEVGKRFLASRKNAGAENSASEESASEQDDSSVAPSGTDHTPTAPIQSRSSAQASAPTTPIPMINTDPNNRR